MQQLPLWVVLLVAVLGPAVGGIMALLGVFLGPWMKARTDMDQWRRERKLDAYVELSRTAHDLLEATARRFLEAPGEGVADPQLVAKLNSELDRAWFELQRASRRVELIAPAYVGKAAAALSSGAMDNYGLTRIGMLHADSRRVINDGLELFMAAAQRDLGS